MAVSEYTRSYNSFSGVDIKATFGTVVIGELQGISYSVTREKAPIYTMGSADPRSFSRGKRGIAGTLIFTVFDRSALIAAFEGKRDGTGWFFAHDTDIARRPVEVTDAYGKSVNEARGEQVHETVFTDNYWTAAWYPDQLPPFDVVLTAANEYGQVARMNINAVEILNEGSGVSVDDIVTEQQMTFIAREVVPWRPRPDVDQHGWGKNFDINR
jgi:hypothetical protein